MGKQETEQNDTRNVKLTDYPDVMNIEQMSQILGISVKTGYKMLKEHKITGMKAGRAYRIPKVHVMSYLKIENNIAAQI